MIGLSEMLYVLDGKRQSKGMTRFSMKSKEDSGVICGDRELKGSVSYALSANTVTLVP